MGRDSLHLFGQSLFDGLLRGGIERKVRTQVGMTGQHETKATLLGRAQRLLVRSDHPRREIFEPGEGNESQSLPLSSFFVREAMAQKVKGGPLVAEENLLPPPACQ